MKEVQQNEALEGYQAHKAGQIERREEAKGERERRERERERESVCPQGNNGESSKLFFSL